MQMERDYNCCENFLIEAIILMDWLEQKIIVLFQAFALI